jgi:CheY-like chemotaxis protein
MAINEEGITMAPSVNLLLVEDDEVDVQGLKRAFNRSRIGNPITVARDGIEALEILRGQNGHQKLPKPHLVLVFMITTSKAEEDKQRAYGHNVAGYIVKQDPANTFVEAVSLLEHYWKIVEFPG